jgi:hypothetical protein
MNRIRYYKLSMDTRKDERNTDKSYQSASNPEEGPDQTLKITLLAFIKL